MRPILRAIRLFGRERGLWAYALKPLLWGLGAYVLVVFLAALLGERVGEALGTVLHISAGTGGGVGLLLGFVLTIVFGGAIYLALVGLIAGFGFDRLSIEVEERAFGSAVGRAGGGIGDGIARAILAGACGIGALCLGATVVAPWLIASFLCLLDFTAPALLRRGVPFSRQFGVVSRLPGAWPFALVAGLIVLVPVVNVLALPILVAAGTILVAEGSATVRG